jgi:hypothetical protein
LLCRAILHRLQVATDDLHWVRDRIQQHSLRRRELQELCEQLDGISSQPPASPSPSLSPSPRPTTTTNLPLFGASGSNLANLAIWPPQPLPLPIPPQQQMHTVTTVTAQPSTARAEVQATAADQQRHDPVPTSTAEAEAAQHGLHTPLPGKGHAYGSSPSTHVGALSAGQSCGDGVSTYSYTTGVTPEGGASSRSLTPDTSRASCATSGVTTAAMVAVAGGDRVPATPAGVLRFSPGLDNEPSACNAQQAQRVHGTLAAAAVAPASPAVVEGCTPLEAWHRQRLEVGMKMGG